MDRFPQMLYCFPAAGPDIAALQDGAYGTRIVADEAEFDAALAECWCETSPAARAAHEQRQAAAALEAAAASAKPADETTPPTRAELEAKATELGIKFDGRSSNKKLGDQIAAALEP
jgi:hypothetical protein